MDGSESTGEKQSGLPDAPETTVGRLPVSQGNHLTHKRWKNTVERKEVAVFPPWEMALERLDDNQSQTSQVHFCQHL